MKKYKNHILYALSFSLIALSACEKEQIADQHASNSVPLSQNSQMIQYCTYHGKTYEIILNYDSDYHIVSVEGDGTAFAEMLNQKTVKPTAFFVQLEDSLKNSFSIHLFDDEEAMDKFRAGKGLPGGAQEKSCTDWTSTGGTANYRFYEHDNYVNEFTSLNLNNQSYFQRQYFSWENDKISSLKLWGTTTGASVDIFENSCFSGKKITFAVNTPGQVLSIPSLSLYNFDWCVDIIRDIYGNFIGTYGYPCGGSWNDKISSIKGWSI